MSKYIDDAVKLRAETNPHYNCAQSVVVPFAVDAGITRETAFKMMSNFGGGLKMGATCGAIAGGITVLGLFGVDDVSSYYSALRERHDGIMDCAGLLAVNKKNGGEKKAHCDAMVYECISLVEDILRNRGLIA